MRNIVRLALQVLAVLIVGGCAGVGGSAAIDWAGLQLRGTYAPEGGFQIDVGSAATSRPSADV